MSPTLRPPGPSGPVLMAPAEPMRSVPIAYILWLFLGGMGLHRFYVGRTFSGGLMLAITLLSLLFTLVLIGLFGLALVAIWWLVDAFLIPGMVQDRNAAIAASRTARSR
ncbi:TM2 domain-containing protein [Muricoccus radiodurans]|uniref:TM2 domain-containing protein n=1 Tax=Muricoccus radiodurans TaxID=2231721 RepID=UPI003CF7FB1C